MRARGNPGILVMNKIVCTTVLIAKTFDVQIMLNIQIRCRTCIGFIKPQYTYNGKQLTN